VTRTTTSQLIARRRVWSNLKRCLIKAMRGVSLACVLLAGVADLEDSVPLIAKALCRCHKHELQCGRQGASRAASHAGRHPERTP